VIFGIFPLLEIDEKLPIRPFKRFILSLVMAASRVEGCGGKRNGPGLPREPSIAAFASAALAYIWL
jgi:hypothetical protein